MEPVTMTELAGWSNARLWAEYESLIAHTAEDALDNGEMRMLGLVCLTLSDRVKGGHA